MKTTALFLVLSIAYASIGNAASIGLDFSTDQGGGIHDLAPTDVTGVVAQGNWNNAHGPTSSLGPLVDASGTATTATTTWSSGNSWDGNIGYGDPLHNLLNVFLDGGSGGQATVTISNVPYANYDVYVYMQSNQGGQSDFTVNGNTKFGQNTSTAAFVESTSSAVAGTYVHFTNMTGTTMTLIANNPTFGDFRSSVDGIQIVNTPIPEPTSLVLLGLGAIGLFVVARRRRMP